MDEVRQGQRLVEERLAAVLRHVVDDRIGFAGTLALDLPPGDGHRPVVGDGDVGKLDVFERVRDYVRVRPGVTAIGRAGKEDPRCAIAGEPRIREVDEAVTGSASAIHLDGSLVVEFPEQVRCLRTIGDGARIGEVAGVPRRSPVLTKRILVATDPDIAVGLLGKVVGRNAGGFRPEVGVAVRIPGNHGIARAGRVDLGARGSR